MSPSSRPEVMAFYSPDAAMGQRLASLMQRFGSAASDSLARGLSVTWVRYPQSLSPADPSSQASARPGAPFQPGADGPSPGRGASWQGGALRDPGDLVQLVYLCAAERWLQRDMLPEEPELRRALEAMTRLGSHEATSYVVDRLSGTTSGPSLPPHRRQAWMRQRQLVNGWLASLGWPELEGCQAQQKTWQEGPYGRERDGLGAAGEHANRCSSEALARLLEAVLAGTLISPPACQRMRALLEDPPLPPWLVPLRSGESSGSARLWGQAGRKGRAVQLALYAESAAAPATLLVLLAGEEIAAEPTGVLAPLVGELLSADPIRAPGPG